MTAPPDDRGQLDFLQHVQRIFDEGEFVATYKFALLIALVELAIERGDDTGAPLDLDLHSIAEKFIEQYWPHAAPYNAADGAPAVLVQNNGRQAAIVARVAEVRGRFGSLTRAKSDRSWPGFVGSIAQIVKEMPLWKLQTLRRRNVPFLYERSSGPRITLLPGVAFNLRRFGALIQLLARSACASGDLECLQEVFPADIRLAADGAQGRAFEGGVIRQGKRRDRTIGISSSQPARRTTRRET